MTELFLLGSGGGRFSTITQRRFTGGFRIHTEKNKMHVDPGPGALVRTHQFGLNPTDITTLIISHCHPDHATDGPVFIEAMTRGMTKQRGTLIGSKSVLEGVDGYGPVILEYHKQQPKKIIVVEPGDDFKVSDTKISVTPAIHSDPATVGFRFETKKGVIAYTCDTEYFEDLPKYHKGARILIACVTRPLDAKIPGHMCSDDVIKLLQETSPEIAFLTHLGMRMIYEGPNKEAKRIEKETGVKTMPAEAGLIIRLDKEIEIERKKKQRTLETYF